MKRISFPGDDRGFALLDAIVSLLISALAVICITAGVSMAMRAVSTSREKTISAIETENALTERIYGKTDGER
jgi:Tfp pilus assembly protein PilV